MSNDITALAQSHELLIANGNETANLLRHLANNEIDSDYFAVVSECESYGQETEAELSITDFALRAAGYVDALVEALEKAQTENGLVRGQLLIAQRTLLNQQQRIAELENAASEPVAWTDEQELRDVEKSGCGYLFTVNPITPNADPRRVIKLYTVPPAMESLTVTVKLPDERFRYGESDYDDGYVNGWNAHGIEVKLLLADAGIQVIEGEE